MSDVVLLKGQNAPLPTEVNRLRLVVAWDHGGQDVDASALLLGEDGRVRSDEDFVFYNQPSDPEGAVTYLGGSATESGSQQGLAVDLESVRADVATIAVTASVNNESFGSLAGLRLLVLGATGELLASHELTGLGSETALLLGEVYRRGERWKVRAVGQGWSSGLAGLAQDFGVTVADDGADEMSGLGEEPATAVETSEEPDRSEVRQPEEHADDEEMVDVVESTSSPVEASTAGSDPAEDALAVVIDLPTARDAAVAQAPGDSSAAPVRSRGVQTRKQATKATVPPLRLALDETWTPARLFSISGVGNAEEQEKRATSALLATMMGVKSLGRGIVARVGAPAGTMETYLEVPFPHGDGVVIPDGVIRVARGSRQWTALLETKTGSGQLRREQIENYLDVARRQGFDAVITLSNEIAPAIGEHPVEVDRRKLAKVGLFHISWAEVLHEAQMVLTHRGVEDSLQAWLLHELVRYLQHPRSGASGFEDMGPSWVAVRESVAAGTLRAGDRKTPAVADAWTRLIRHLSLRLTAELGVNVAHVLPRKLATDPVARTRSGAEALAENGCLTATLKVPGAVGPVTVIADLRTSQVPVSTRLPAPQEGTAQRRISWLLRQLRNAPDDLLIEVSFSGGAESTCELLRDVRDKATALVPSTKAELTGFTLTRSQPLGTKRSGVRGAFIPSVTQAVEAFYGEVVQPLRPWVPPAPRLPDDVVEAESVTEEAESDGLSEQGA